MTSERLNVLSLIHFQGGSASKAGSDNNPPTLTSAILDAQIQAHHSRVGTVNAPRAGQERQSPINPPIGLSSNTPLAGASTGTAGVATQGVSQGPVTSGGTVQRPTRLSQPDKLIMLAASTGQIQRTAPGSVEEKGSTDPGSTSSTPVDPTTATTPQAKARARTKRASSSGSMNSESTPPESPADTKKKNERA